VVPDAGALPRVAAMAAVTALTGAVRRHGDATWVLAGGRTPLAAYRLLAAGRLRDAVPWPRLRVAVGDERAVPATDPDSNWGQAAAALLDHVPIPAEGRLAPRGELGADAAAADYTRQLDRLPKTRAGWPRLDVCWIGAGEDGHCLSLFPGHPEVEAAKGLVTPVHGAPKPPPDRISLTLPALRGVGCLLILAAGAGKAEALARVRAGEPLPVARAAREVAAAGGTVRWLLDQAAAGH
jgi:6-phosphogluconolactonase